jgi:DNA-binding CsgD family transcriptional regulator
MTNEGRVPATGAFLSRTPFVGRENESARMRARLEEARAGRGGLVMLVGEPGIGKTRTAEEFAEYARGEGATVLWGRCYDGEWSPPYGPFAEAIAEYVRAAPADALRADLGFGAPPIARLVPALREALPGIEDPVALQPDEERFRMLDAVSQFLIAVSQRAPVVLVLDDLHWADKGTIAMLRHIARFASQNKILIAGAYRDVELDESKPLAGALDALRAETALETVEIGGLGQNEVDRLVSAITEEALPKAFVSAIGKETDGNPFFIREVLLHLVHSGALYETDGKWEGDVSLISEIGLPAGIRQAIERRLTSLSENARRLLTAAAAFEGVFPFAIAAAAVGMEEERGLSALDEALRAQIVRPGGGQDTCEFVHALIRHTLYAALSPPRQVRLHREIAKAMEAVYGQSAPEHAAEIASHYHRSATLPGSEGGVAYALAAADRAEAAAAHEDTASFLRIALDLLPDGDGRRPRIMARLALTLPFALQIAEALARAREAASLIAASEGDEAAAAFLARVLRALHSGGWLRAALDLVPEAVVYTGDRRDAAWAAIKVYELMRREDQDPDSVGIQTDTPERRELIEVVKRLPASERERLVETQLFFMSEEVLVTAEDAAVGLLERGPSFKKALRRSRERAALAEERGQLREAAAAWVMTARNCVALGDLTEADAAFRRGVAIGARLPGPTSSVVAFDIAAARYDRQFARGEGLGAMSGAADDLLRSIVLTTGSGTAPIRALAAHIYAEAGRANDAIQLVGGLREAIEMGAGGVPDYAAMIYGCIEALWILQRTDHIEVIARGIREKVVVPDFPFTMMDSRRSLALLCALQRRYDEASNWFAKARAVLDEEGSRTLRALVDYDEALMYVRRGRRGDRNRAAPLVAAALSQFREIGMTGWITRGEELQRRIAERLAGQAVYPDGLTPREVDVLRLITRGGTNAGIASELTLSVRTVGRHVTNLYTKIHAHNRAEAVDYAHRHDLT